LKKVSVYQAGSICVADFTDPTFLAGQDN
jgi:hypothetical protein